MDKNTILNYVTETPGNTNRAVLGSMLDSIEGGSSVEMGTVFEDDITLTYASGGQFSRPYGRCDIHFSTITTTVVIKVTFENMVLYAVPLIPEGYFRCSIDVSNPELPFVAVAGTFSPSDNTFTFTITSDSEEGSQDPDLEAYCQEPHHLKVEWFII